MLPLLKRHQLQVLLEAGHSQREVSELAGVSVRTVKRVAMEDAVEHVDDGRERRRRAIGRPSKVAAYQAFVAELLGRSRG